MTDIKKLYEKETGNDARNIRFTAYSTWLEQKAAAKREGDCGNETDRESRL